jgi:hypothetical protein
MNTSPVAGLVRAWVDLYTRGVPEPARSARRDEVEDDLWCQHEEAAAIGRSSTSVSAEMLVRLLFGMPADVGWRIANGRVSGSPIPRYPTTGIRILAVMAIVGAVGWGVAAIGYTTWGESAWVSNGYLMYYSQLVGGLGLAAAAVGLALRFQDRMSTVGAMAGVLGGLMSLFGAMGAYQLTVMLPIGSGIFAWELGRVRILPRSLATLHAVSALLFFALAMAGLGGWNPIFASVVMLALALPYLLSWIGIGLWLIGGVPIPGQPDRATHRLP